MIDQKRMKVAVSVIEMANMVGLSRARFYQLLGSAFPWPVYDIVSRRPFFTEEQQHACLEVRQNNRGVNGKAVLFYGRRHRRTPSPVVTKRPIPMAPARSNAHDDRDDLVAAVRSLGLTWVTPDQVAEAVDQLFPAGMSGIDRGELIRAVFVRLKRK